MSSIDIRRTKSTYNFLALEQLINAELEKGWRELMADEARCKHFAGLFDRTVEEAFYDDGIKGRGEGEQPTWSANPAYMNSIEELWESSEKLLTDLGLALEHPLREAFFTSREYKDRTMEHRRVFTDQIVRSDTGKAVTLYALSVSHSHAGFDYVEPPSIFISKALKSRQDPTHVDATAHANS